ncbi:MAG TPA: GIY-YIG nuclease family protein [Bacteroidales bacterium]|nr:GIY-YIG nuclease family protein [Bacteroidales bacterium]
MRYYIYILYSEKFDKYYYGQTNDLKERLIKHNSKKVNSTAKYSPWIIFAYKELETRSEAIAFERKIKNLKSRTRVHEYLRKHRFIFRDEST